MSSIFAQSQEVKSEKSDRSDQPFAVQLVEEAYYPSIFIKEKKVQFGSSLVQEITVSDKHESLRLTTGKDEKKIALYECSFQDLWEESKEEVKISIALVYYFQLDANRLDSQGLLKFGIDTQLNYKTLTLQNVLHVWRDPLYMNVQKYDPENSGVSSEFILSDRGETKKWVQKDLGLNALLSPKAKEKLLEWISGKDGRLITIFEKYVEKIMIVLLKTSLCNWYKESI
jgi:hypothetical protein